MTTEISTGKSQQHGGLVETWLICCLAIGAGWRQYTAGAEPLISAMVLGRITLVLLVGAVSYYGAKKYFRRSRTRAWPVALMARWRLAHQLVAGIAAMTAMNHAALNVGYYQFGATPKLLLGSGTLLTFVLVVASGLLLQRGIAAKKSKRLHWLLAMLLLPLAIIHKFL